MVGISVVVCSNDEQKFERVSSLYARLLGGGQFEVVRVRDAREGGGV